MNRKLLPSILFLALCIQTAHCTILYANANVQGGNQDGTSWTDAFPLLQSAIIAAQDGDTVWVAQGTYLPTTGTNRNISFTLKNGVRMFGGFAGVETALGERDWEANETILSGDIGAPGDSTDNSYTVVYCNFADSTTVLDGFTITGGNADSQVMFEPSNGRTKSGGGLYLIGSSQTEDTRPVIINCKFTGNHAINNGGAVFMISTVGSAVSPAMINCLFEQNSSSRGGALFKSGSSVIHNMFIADCTFISNHANYGGGLFYLNNYGSQHFIVQDCTFQFNSSVATGGGLSQEISNPISEILVKGCFFHGNTTLEGGAISNISFVFSEGLGIDSCDFLINDSNAEGAISFGGDGQAEITNSSFIGNKGNTGGCITTANSLNAINCFFANSTADEGTVIYEWGSVAVKFINCTFFLNTSTVTGLARFTGDSTILFINSAFLGNSLFSNNKLMQFSNSTANLSISHCILDIPDCASIANGPVTCGPGMLYLQDPLFTDTAAGDFTLLPCSPAINAGDNAIVDSLGILTDLAGNPRILGGTVDMGAYEAPAFAVAEASVPQPSCGGAADGAVQFQLAHGCEPFSYAWTSGAASGTGTSGLLPGSYSFTVTDALGKTVEAQVEIPDVPAVAATAAAQPYDCTDTAGGTASITPTGGTAPFNYLWSNADTTAAIASLLPGSYIVTVTGANGCTLSDSVQVEITGHLTLSIDVTPTHCSDSDDGTAAITPLGGTAPFGWLWQDDQTDSLLTGLGGGSYSVTVTDAVGCTGDVQFSMTAPDTLVAEATGTDVLCAGQSTGTATATATGGTPIAIGAYSYHWSNAMTTPAIGPLPSGTYAVTVSDGNGCSDTASVFIASPPALSVSVEATAVLCFGEHDGTAAALASGGTPIAIGAYTFLWNNGLTDSLLTGLPPGSYAVTVTDAHDCTQVGQAQIDSSTQIQALFQITHATAAATADGGVEVSLVFGGTPGYSFLWSNGALTQSLQGVLPGPYTLTVTDADSCQNVFYFTVDVGNAAGEAAANPFRAVIVPNPSGADGAELWLELARPQALTVEVYDGLGRLVFSKKAFAAAGESRRDLPLPAATGLLPGVYWVVVKNGDGAARVLAWGVE